MSFLLKHSMFKTIVNACIFFISPFLFASQVIIPSAPELAAKSYFLMDAATGKVLVENNADLAVPPASLTKMMTSYIVSEEIAAGRVKENELVTISDDAWRRGGTKSGSSTMFLEPRTQVSVIDLMRGVIIQSGNDASIALAQHIAGSEDAFADIMNQQAKLLGMQNTQFVNSTGWPADGHVSTAKDMAILAQAVVQDHPEHYDIYAERYFKYNGINQPNRNKLLFSNKFVDGLKTGHTEAAGYCLVASAEQNGMRLISVVMGTKSKQSRAAESQRLLVYGFRNFQTDTLYRAADVMSTARVWGGVEKEISLGVKNDVVATIPRDSKKNLKAETQIDSVIKAPIAKGQVLGKLMISLDDELIAEQDIVAQQAIEQAGFISRTYDSILLMITGPE